MEKNNSSKAKMPYLAQTKVTLLPTAPHTGSSDEAPCSEALLYKKPSTRMDQVPRPAHATEDISVDSMYQEVNLLYFMHSKSAF